MHTLTFTVFPEMQAPYVATLSLRTGAHLDLEGGVAPAVPPEVFTQGAAPPSLGSVDAISGGVLLLGTRYGELLSIVNVLHTTKALWVDVAQRAWAWGDVRAASARWASMQLSTSIDADAGEALVVEKLFARMEALTPLVPAHAMLYLAPARPLASAALPAITTTLQDPQAKRVLGYTTTPHSTR